MTGQEIKKSLKKKGYNTKGISIRKTHGSYRAEIKDLSIDKNIIEKEMAHLESYQRDEVTQEILCGGNTFVFVDYDWDIIAEKAKALKETVINKITSLYKGEITNKAILKEIDDKTSDWTGIIYENGLCAESLKDIMIRILTYGNTTEEIKEKGLLVVPLTH